MIPDLKEITIDELNPFEGDPSLILTENPQGLWKKMDFDPQKKDPFNESCSFLALEDNKIINKNVPFDFASAQIQKDLPFPNLSGLIEWPVKWDSYTEAPYGMIDIKDSTFVLKPGYKYKATAWLSGASLSSGSKEIELRFQWYNNTTKKWIGFPGYNKVNTNQASSSFNPAISFLILSTPYDKISQEIVLMVNYVNPAGIPDHIAAGSNFLVELLP